VAAAATSVDSDPLDFQDMAIEQGGCPKMQGLIADSSSLKIQFKVLEGLGQ
jgi:hypothetical protein